jgi:hypothetical protein
MGGRWGGRAMRRLAGASATAACLVLAGCGTTATPTSPEPAPLESLAPVVLGGPPVGVERDITTVPVQTRRGDAPDGPQLFDDLGNPLRLDAGRLVVPLGPPRAGPGGQWVRVWVAPSQTVYPGDFVAWILTTIRGQAVLQPLDRVACPRLATIASLARLIPPDRLRCAGATELTFDARSWLPGVVPTYDVDPAWYGTNADPAGTTSLFDPGPVAFGPGAATTPEAAGAWIDARVPPTVPRIPLGVLVRVTGRFDDPSAAGCRRSRPNGGAAAGIPVEAAPDSIDWCREQLVVSAWQVVLGAEGRPFDPADPQLHRFEFVPPPGAQIGCGGVGMEPFIVRIDAEQVEPVWLDVGRGRRAIAVFGPTFHLLPDPERVQATTGPFLLDGEVVDPDRPKAGLGVCPGGDVVTFDTTT